VGQPGYHGGMLPDGVHHFPGHTSVSSAHTGADAVQTAAALEQTLRGTPAQGLV